MVITQQMNSIDIFKVKTIFSNINNDSPKQLLFVPIGVIGIAEVLILLGVAGPVKRSLGKIGKKAGIEQYYNGYIIYFKELCS